MGSKRPRLRALAKELARRHPEVDDPCRLIEVGEVLVDGFIVTNPASLVHVDASISLRRPKRLRGEVKLRAALARFAVPVRGRSALDLGAAAGGFTRALLDAEARRVYAVDVGHGQLLGSLRVDPRVVNLERTNLGQLDAILVPDEIGVVTLDLSYLAIARAVAQLSSLHFQPGAILVALVKPMFELGLARPPADSPRLTAALNRAAAGLTAEGWEPIDAMTSPVRGARGAIEFFIHAQRE